jgi:predicted transcriptional regulator
VKPTIVLGRHQIRSKEGKQKKVNEKFEYSERNEQSLKVTKGELSLNDSRENAVNEIKVIENEKAEASERAKMSAEKKGPDVTMETVVVDYDENHCDAEDSVGLCCTRGVWCENSFMMITFCKNFH